MKNGIEENIKTSLQGYEMPYDKNAWTSMSQRLDAVMPITPKPTFGKFFIGGAAIVGIAVTTYVMWPKEKTENNIVAKELSTITDDNDQETINKTIKESAPSTVTNAEKSTIKTENATQQVAIPRNRTEQLAPNVVPNPPANNANNTQLSTSNTSNNTNNNIPEIGQGKEIIVPTVDNLCLGDQTIIKNENYLALYILDPNGAKTKIAANKAGSFSGKLEGKHEVGVIENGNFKSLGAFNVLSLPKVEFTIDDQNIYEQGIPSIALKANSNGSSYQWKFENQSEKVYGKEVNVHYFKKGTYDITLTVQGVNGCQAVAQKPLTIREDYNLLAVNAFDPMSSDNRKNQFIPFALTQRNVDFNMIIIDPKDGAVIFETNDATNTWKGVDKRNGQLVEKNQPYVWRVIINNPIRGEQPEYKGTIIRL